MLDEPLDCKIFSEREKEHLKEKQNCFGVKKFCWELKSITGTEMTLRVVKQ